MTDTPQPLLVRRETLRGRLSAWLLRGFGCLPLGCNRWLGAGVGWLTYLFARRTTAICRDNIAKCWPQLTARQQRRLARRSMVETGKTALETTSIWQRDYPQLAPYVIQVEGEELITQARQQGTGVLLLAPHLGNWEIIGGYLAQLTKPLYMYQPTELPEVDNIMVAGRTRFGGQLAPANRRGVSMVLEHLKAGELAAILPDQVPTRQGGQVVPFFGQPALTMTLIHKLIQRTNPRVLMTFAERVPGGFHLRFKPTEPALHDADVVTSLSAMNRDIEALVRMAPEQYQWEYKRFKRV